MKSYLINLILLRQKRTMIKTTLCKHWLNSINGFQALTILFVSLSPLLIYFGLGHWGTTGVLLPLVFFLFLITFVKPILGIYLIPVITPLPDFQLFSVLSYKVVFSLYLFGVTFVKGSLRDRRGDISILWNNLLPAVLFLLWMIISAIGTYSIDTQFLRYTVFPKLPVFLMAFLIGYHVYDDRRLKIFYLCFALSAIVPAIMALSQTSLENIPHYLSFNLQFFRLSSVTQPVIRISGFQPSFIYFSYLMMVCFITIVGPFLLGGLKNLKEKFFIFLTAGLCSIGLVGAITRSSNIGALFALFYLLLVRRFSRKENIIVSPKMVYLFFTLFLLIIPIVIIMTPYKGILLVSEPSMASRFALFRASASVAFRNPLFGSGIGKLYSSEVEDIYGEISWLPFSGVVLTTTSHNQLLLLSAYFGFPAMLLLVWLYYSMLRSLFRGLRSNPPPFTKSIGITLIAVLLAYALTSSFHNAGPFIGDRFFWNTVGMVIAFSRISRRNTSVRKQNTL